HLLDSARRGRLRQPRHGGGRCRGVDGLRDRVPRGGGRGQGPDLALLATRTRAAQQGGGRRGRGADAERQAVVSDRRARDAARAAGTGPVGRVHARTAGARAAPPPPRARVARTPPPGGLRGETALLYGTRGSRRSAWAGGATMSYANLAEMFFKRAQELATRPRY